MKSVTFGIAKINRAKQGLNIRQRVMLYHAIIQPHLDYCSTVWSTASKCLLEKILVKQRSAVRAILNYQEEARADVMEMLGIQPAVERWKKLESLWLYKIRKMEPPAVPKYLKDILEFKDLSGYMSLRRPKSIVAHARTKTGQETLAFRLRQLFVKLEDLVENSTSLKSFRSAIWRLNLTDL